MALIALFALAGTFVYLYHRNSVKSQEIAQYEQNWKAAMDSVKYYKLENGNLLAERASFILSEQKMCKQLDMSNTELKELKKKLGSTIAQLAKVQSEVRVDSILIPSDPIYISQDSIIAPIQYRDSWMTLSGQYNYANGTGLTSIYNLSMDVPLTIGQTKDMQYFVTSSNPYVHVTDIVSTINEKVVPKKKHWGFGVSIGPSIGYDFHHKDIYYGIGGSIGLIYNF